MRGSMFVATAWGRHPLRPYTPVRMGQTVTCDGDVCRIDRSTQPTQTPMPPPGNTVIPTAPEHTTTPPTESEAFPIVPVAVGAGALILAAILF